MQLSTKYSSDDIKKISDIEKSYSLTNDAINTLDNDINVFQHLERIFFKTWSQMNEEEKVPILGSIWFILDD